MNVSRFWYLPIIAGLYYLYKAFIGVMFIANKDLAARVLKEWGEMVDEVILSFKDNDHYGDAPGFWGIDSGLILAMIAVESAGDPDAVGTSGEVGLMQIMPETWRVVREQVAERIGGWFASPGLSVRDDPYDPRANITVGVANLWNENWWQRYKTGKWSLDQAIRGYNVGYEASTTGAGFEYLQKVRAYQTAIVEIAGGVKPT